MKAAKLPLIGVIGIDEVGRGPLAGPVTVCACFMEDPDHVKELFFKDGIKDSKKLKKAYRESIYNTIRYKRVFKNTLKYSLISKSAAYIDTYGLSHAIRECVRLAVMDLMKKGVRIYQVPIRLDAGLRVPLQEVVQESFIRGDEKYIEIAIASILAKVSRDHYMDKLSTIHSNYGWENNAGYGTVHHRTAISKNGITAYHRKSFLKAFKLFDKS